jgi:alkylation response protein AidB-like acyl-CoA dehydrogenase
MSEKMWGSEPFWGLGYDWDPDWVYTDRQKDLRATLIELCEKELRANAKRFDDELMFPRRNLELLGEHGFLGLTCPRSTAGWARTTSRTRWCARRSRGTAAPRPRCAT